MFEANSDGAGFMFVRNHKVHIRKGFMKFRAFVKGLEQERITKDDLFVAHFRIATAGTISPKNCHPFPVSQSVPDLQSTKIETDLAMAHNGILNYEHDKKEDLSDTMTFIRDILASPSVKNNLLEFSVWSLIEMSIGSGKMVFVNSANEFALLGDWHEDKLEPDGCFYSNLYFRVRLMPRVVYVCGKKSGPDYISDIKGDLDADAYENKTTKIEEFITLQADASVLLFPEDEKCPACDHPLMSDTQQSCFKCGKMFYRSYND